MFKTVIWGGNGNKKPAAVTDAHELRTLNSPEPPLTPQKTQPMRQYFTDDGLPGGNNDMGVDGSSTNVDYCIPASPTIDRYITSLSFIVGYGTTGQPNEWADGAALTNGTRMFYENLFGEKDLHDGIKSNQDMFRLSFGLIPTGWEVRHVNANNDFGYFIAMDLTRLGLPYGVKLDRGSSQKLVLRIRDNVGAAADSFNCIGYGFERFE